MVVPSGSRAAVLAVDRPWNQILFSSFHLKAENIGAYVDAMRTLGIQALECYPSRDTSWRAFSKIGVSVCRSGTWSLFGNASANPARGDGKSV